MRIYLLWSNGKMNRGTFCHVWVCLKECRRPLESNPIAAINLWLAGKGRMASCFSVYQICQYTFNECQSTYSLQRLRTALQYAVHSDDVCKRKTLSCTISSPCPTSPLGNWSLSHLLCSGCVTDWRHWLINEHIAGNIWHYELVHFLSGIIFAQHVNFSFDQPNRCT